MYYPHNDYDENNRQERPIETSYHIMDDQPRKKSGGGRVVALVLCCVLMGGLGGLGGAMLAGKAMNGGGADSSAAVDADTSQTTIFQSQGINQVVNVVDLPASKPLTPAEVYAANVNSCVGITVSTTTNIFGYTTTSAASGSGFVISADGYIVTNYHVIEEAAKSTGVPITVSFQNGNSYDAKLVGGEEDNDVAVLKIDAKGLTPVVLGDSDKLVVGEAVYAIGNPLGELTYTLTDGLVSALDRMINTGGTNDATSLNMLQTNCAINSGNSGGPLFNSYGEVIGITTAKMSSSSTSASVEGLGFAIPINDVKTIIQDLIQYGYVTGKPYLGITVSTVSEADAKRYGLPVGAYVESVDKGSCAQEAGLQVGDIITAIDGTEVTTHSALIASKAQYRAGDSAVLTVSRGGKEMQIKVTFDEEVPTADTETNSGSQIQQGVGGSGGSGNGYGNGGYGGGNSGWPFYPFG